MAKVRWAERARDDLREIYDFIARDSLRAAEALVERVLHSTGCLASFPESGRTVPEVPDLGYRELLVGSYRIWYRIEKETVWIVTVLHGRRLPGLPGVIRGFNEEPDGTKSYRRGATELRP